MTFEERLEQLKDELQKEDFLEARGLGNEIPFWIFDYPADKELLVRNTVDKIVTGLDKESITVLNIDMYDTCLEILEQIPEEKIIALEKKKGSDALLKKLKLMLKPDVLRNSIMAKVEGAKDPDIIFLTGAGKAWPMIRSHSILNNLQPVFDNTPLVLFYPGEYSEFDLSLFGKLNAKNYYRAFRLINI
ncbi:DUF1788 domain-containing protein [Methanococcoides seepicolus]|uniref:DUF1788 domain-containing protein n=1 Tax=Methanococcoides seepicolus TaxID=2828780 RepID=A0A9E5DC63_9EURY|nr:DUF1788 domain-containing protein [Methanococcoides seepicolus]MCM1987073.1 DUF1788 domain-containing protein [Methanococcoides seepicolus]